MIPIHRSVPNLIVQAIPCQVCTELVKLDRMDLISHMENKHMNLSPYYCATCLRGMESSREAIRHYHTCHPSERRVKVIDSSYHYDRQIRTLVTSCFPTIAEDIRLPVVFTTCRQCNRKVRNTPETLNKHMFKHARAYYTEMHPFGIGQANEEDFINDLVALFSGNDGQLYRMFILDACFPGAPTDDSISVTSVRELIAPRMTRPVDGIGQSDYEQEIILDYINPSANPRINPEVRGQRAAPQPLQAPQEVENDDSEDEVDDEFVRNHFRVPNVCEDNDSPDVVETVNGYFD